jgi:RNA polymerase sigma-70 factor (ECF subfamily)
MNRNRADAEDAVAEAMLRAYKHIPARLDNTEAWLTRVTINVCRDLQRTRARTEAVKAQYAQLLLSEAPQDERPQVEECDPHLMLERLPRPLREALVLRVVHSTPYDEIAARLGISPANVRKRVQHARATLRALRNAGALPIAQSLSRASVEVRPDVRGGSPLRVTKKIASLRAYVARHPLGWKIQLQLADLLYATGAWNEAAERYRAVLERRPQLPEALAKLAAIARAIHS